MRVNFLNFLKAFASIGRTVCWLGYFVVFWPGQGLATDTLGQRDVLLGAKIRFENRGSENVPEQVFRLTIPSDIASQQKILSTSVSDQEPFKTFTHPNQVDQFIEIRLRLAPVSVTERQVKVQLRLNPFDYKTHRGNQATTGNSNFLRPTTYVESGAVEVQDLAKKIISSHANDEDRLQAAYRYPQQTLTYRLIENRGALFALHNGYGDCTEYAAIFVATARAMGFPARLTSEFNFEEDGSFEQPNHHAAEVFLKGQWIPVDPNLGTDRKSAYGFGKTGTHKIVLKRDGSWVWSSSTKGVSTSYREANIVVNIEWNIQKL